jgi:uncharacterized repeat protein (TIGR03803 family)
LGAFAAVVLYFELAGFAHGQPSAYTLFTNFNGTGGAYPYSGVTEGPDGSFYGTTYLGGSNLVGTPVRGSNSYGTVFKMTTNGAFAWQLSFSNTNGPVLGAYPDGMLALGPDGAFYGTTFLGGSNGSGTVFKVTTNGLLTSLYSFAPLPGTRSFTQINTDSPATNATGGEPASALRLGPDGNFYSTTVYGGSNGVGTVFRVTTNGTLTSLFSFGPSTNLVATNLNGSRPIIGLTLGADGNFYGATAYGGSGGEGTVFKVTTNGTFTPLAYFDPLVTNADQVTNATGATPTGKLTEGTDGIFYGTTIVGGNGGYGTIFKVTTNGNLTPLFSFAPLVADGYVGTNATGASSDGGLTLGTDGNFYGTTVSGGSGGAGTVFMFATNGAFVPFFYFAPVTVGNGPNADGAQPGQLTLGTDGSFYGTCFNGGPTDYGGVFAIATAALNLRRSAGKAVLTWTNSAFSLQSAATITGTFSNLSGATSPYTNPVTSSQQYFRLIGN